MRWSIIHLAFPVAAISVLLFMLAAGVTGIPPRPQQRADGDHWDSDFDEIRLFRSAAFDANANADENENGDVVKRFVIHDNLPGQWSWGTFIAHSYVVADPFDHVVVLPPPDGCTSGNLSTPKDTANYYFGKVWSDDGVDGVDERRGRDSTRRHGQLLGGCEVATNGGFFDPEPNSTTFGHCLGSVVSEGSWQQRSAARNAAFALAKDAAGREVALVGYMNRSTLDERYKVAQLVSGVVWLVRDGQSFVAESLDLENFTTQTSGSASYFLTLRAARLAIGIDYSSRVVLVAVDGSRAMWEGISLYDFADVLVRMGLRSAINLDGGGSISVFDREVLVNVPSDTCESKATHGDNGGAAQARFPSFKCTRKVASVVCLRGRDTLQKRRDSVTATAATPTRSQSRATSTFTALQRAHASATTTLSTSLSSTPQPPPQKPLPTPHPKSEAPLPRPGTPEALETLDPARARRLGIIVILVVFTGIVATAAFRSYVRGDAVWERAGSSVAHLWRAVRRRVGRWCSNSGRWRGERQRYRRHILPDAAAEGGGAGGAGGDEDDGDIMISSMSDLDAHNDAVELHTV